MGHLQLPPDAMYRMRQDMLATQPELLPLFDLVDSGYATDLTVDDAESLTDFLLPYFLGELDDDYEPSELGKLVDEAITTVWRGQMTKE